MHPKIVTVDSGGTVVAWHGGLSAALAEDADVTVDRFDEPARRIESRFRRPGA